jgi:IS30 family transposase
LYIDGKHRYRVKAATSRSKVQNRKDLEECPDIIDNSVRFGEWELDLVDGSQEIVFILLF